MATAYLSLGSNLGDRAQHLIDAIEAIGQTIGKVILVSSVYESEAVGFKGNAFFNQVIQIETDLSPESLLQKTQEIEKKMGRKQKTVFKDDAPVYNNRTMDIDILLYDNLQIDTEILTLPHPRMLEREFVMKPLRELCSVQK
jgi:2-amino-4-hydroxy-6-hydroxymethyldihydropteridine diphosphokinase